jgi:hypothetical protein
VSSDSSNGKSKPNLPAWANQEFLAEEKRIEEYKRRIDEIRSIDRSIRRPPEDEIIRNKERDLEQWLERLVKSQELDAAYGLAEECLRILNYLEDHQKMESKKKQKSRPAGNAIDPIHTLIERLIESRYLDQAEQVSILYLFFLTGRA